MSAPRNWNTWQRLRRSALAEMGYEGQDAMNTLHKEYQRSKQAMDTQADTHPLLPPLPPPSPA